MTIAVFAASIKGMSDITHLGTFDIPMLSNIPNLVYLAPTTKQEYLAMLDWAMEQNEHPVAIRVPSECIDGKPAPTDYSEPEQVRGDPAGQEHCGDRARLFLPAW